MQQPAYHVTRLKFQLNRRVSDGVLKINDMEVV